MATEREEDLLLLIEILTKELFSLGVSCNDVRCGARLKLTEFAHEEDVEFEDLMDFDGIREYDQFLANTVNHIGDLIHLASERAKELRAARNRSGD
jgi:hypothetical protein